MYVIITLRSLGWIFTTLIATLLMVHAILSPYWLIGETQIATISATEKISYTPTLGISAKCGKPIRQSDPRRSSCVTLAVRGLATDSTIYPTTSKASTVFITTGLIIMSMTVMSSLASCCFQSIFRKSIFTMSGAIQSIAGMFYITGIMLFPMGWDVLKVQDICGPDASPFYPGNCSLGSGLYIAVVATLLTLLSAYISQYAEKSTSSDKVQDSISEGKALICLP